MNINTTEINQRPFGYACMQEILLVMKGAVFWQTGRDKRSLPAYAVHRQSQDPGTKRISKAHVQKLASFSFRGMMRWSF